MSKPTWAWCDERYVPVDQCPDCRCVPNGAHNPDCEGYAVLMAEGYRETADESLQITREFAGSNSPPDASSQESASFTQCENSGSVNDEEYAEPESPIFDEVRYPDTWPDPKTANPLHTHMSATFAACLDVSRRKNQDYASTADPLANFRVCKQFGVTLPQGIMVRLSDKFSRIGNLLDGHSPAVQDERLEDTIQDAINYLAILAYALATE
jgi:hypothetical protein